MLCFGTELGNLYLIFCFGNLKPWHLDVEPTYKVCPTTVYLKRCFYIYVALLGPTPLPTMVGNSGSSGSYVVRALCIPEALARNPNGTETRVSTRDLVGLLMRFIEQYIHSYIACKCYLCLVMLFSCFALKQNWETSISYFALETWSHDILTFNQLTKFSPLLSI